MLTQHGCLAGCAFELGEFWKPFFCAKMIFAGLPVLSITLAKSGRGVFFCDDTEGGSAT